MNENLKTTSEKKIEKNQNNKADYKKITKKVVEIDSNWR